MTGQREVLCAVCYIEDPAHPNRLGTNQTARLCPACAAAPWNAGWNQRTLRLLDSAAIDAAHSVRHGDVIGAGVAVGPNDRDDLIRQLAAVGRAPKERSRRKRIDGRWQWVRVVEMRALTLREIAKIAGVSHPTVLAVLR